MTAPSFLPSSVLSVRVPPRTRRRGAPERSGLICRDSDSLALILCLVQWGWARSCGHWAGVSPQVKRIGMYKLRFARGVRLPRDGVSVSPAGSKVPEVPVLAPTLTKPAGRVFAAPACALGAMPIAPTIRANVNTCQRLKHTPQGCLTRTLGRGLTRFKRTGMQQWQTLGSWDMCECQSQPPNFVGPSTLVKSRS